MRKPFSQACENNKDPILAVLRDAFADARTVLEVGSGTGQHAVHFAAHLPHLRWQPSDRADNLPGIRRWCEDAALPNLAEPIELDVTGDWPDGSWDGVFSANTLHIMHEPAVAAFFAGAARALAPGGALCVYGPFNEHGRYTSDSNAEFDAFLRARDPGSGLRDKEAVQALAEAQGLAWVADHPMPANNRLLQWRRA